MKIKNNTSWGAVAKWYEQMLADKNSFQINVILPNLTRLMNLKKGERVLDLACGTGFFSNIFASSGAHVQGVDIGRELIKIAEQNSPVSIQYSISSADKIPQIKNASIDKIAIILAIQNIENVGGVFAECARVLKPGGSIFVVLNHPAYRNPKQTSWGWDDENGIEYRRVDKYLSESKIKIDMHPGQDESENTISFHRPLQYYCKQMSKNNLAIARLEEWISHRQGPKGKRFAASEMSRKEIPLFLCLEIKKI
jgi:ubiquinone/menaquinone biosynthesis C-methylase UbiE